MANENLKNALRTAGLTSEQFSQIIDVDPKTVQRWVSGRTPYPRHRATIARALDLTEHDLWPDDVPSPASTPGLVGQTRTSGDVIAWGKPTDPGAPDLIAFIANAVDQVDLLDDGRGLLRTAGLMDALRERARGGSRVRVLTYTPGRELGPLIGDDRIEPFVSKASPGRALIRAGDQMLVTLSFPGVTDQPPPLLQLHRQTKGGLFDSLTEHFQLLAEHAVEPMTLRQQVDASLTDDNEDDEDRDERRDSTARRLSNRRSRPATVGRHRVNRTSRGAGHAGQADRPQAGRGPKTTAPKGNSGQAGVDGRTTGDRFAPAVIAATAKRNQRRGPRGSRR